MKENISRKIERFVEGYQKEYGTETAWGTPLVAFASTGDPLFHELKKVVSATHALPEELLPAAKTVIAYFLPFEKSVVGSNIAGRLASYQWARAYMETNRLIDDVGAHLKGYLESAGHEVATTPPTHNFDPRKLMSDWSHRHVAYIAGLGRFGLNNMLITKKGCCGRIGSFITSLRVEPDVRPEEESCLYFHDSSCQQCVERCVNDALFTDGFDRAKCYEMCLDNAAYFRKLGEIDVCGKCLVGVPCSWIDPVNARGNRGK